MINAFNRMNRLLERFIFMVILASMALGYLFAPHLAPWKGAVPYLFGFMTLSTALGCSSRDFMGVFRNPLPILTVLALLHGIHPVFARFIGTTLFGAHDPSTAALVLGTAVPIGVTSVIWAGMLRANVPLALTAVTVDTLLAPLLVPLTILLFAGRAVSFDTASMMLGLVRMIVAPTIIGVALNDLSGGSLNRLLKPYTNPLSKVSLGFVVAINVAAARGGMGELGSGYPLILLGLGLQCVFGYLSSFMAAKWMGMDEETGLTVTFSGGIRNISAGIVIAMAYFPANVAVPVVLSMLFQQPLATVASKLIKRFGYPVPMEGAGVAGKG